MKYLLKMQQDGFVVDGNLTAKAVLQDNQADQERLEGKAAPPQLQHAEDEA